MDQQIKDIRHRGSHEWKCIHLNAGGSVELRSLMDKYAQTRLKYKYNNNIFYAGTRFVILG